ncbi:MAG: TIGR03016 family PEP-CTERM system-associated outer membrane protein [Rhodospirillaceae bacterium]
MVSLPAAADTTKISGSVGSRIETSDNLNGASRKRAAAGLTAIQFGTTDFVIDTPRVNLTYDYGLNFDSTFSTRSTENFQHTMLGVGKAELYEDILYIDGRVMRNQALVNPLGPEPASTTGNRNNLTTEQLIEISPSLVHSFGRLAKAELRYRYRGTFVDDATIGNSEAREESFIIRSGDAWSQVALTATADHLKVVSDQSTGNLETFTDEITGQYALSREFSLLAGVGVERIDRGTLTDAPYEPIWDIGFKVRPGPRSELRLTYGQRFGGTSIDGTLYYQITPRLTLRADYRESVETTQQTGALSQLARATGLEVGAGAGLQSGQIFDPVTGRAVDVNNPGRGLQPDVVTVRRFDGSLTANFDRSTAMLILFDEQRDSTVQPNLHITDLEARYNRQLSPDSTINAGLTVRHASQGSGGTSDSLIERVSFSYSLSKDLAASVGYTRVDTFGASSSKSSSENMIFAQLQIRF